jgi:ribokinase
MNSVSKEAGSGGRRGSVLVLGSICIDLAAFSAKAPTAGQTIIGDDFALVLGGKGSNQAIAAALAGSKSTLISCIGQDLFADFAKDSLSAFGVATDHVKAVPGPTGIAHIRIDAAGENNIVVVPLANSKISEQQIDAAMEHSDADTLLIQLEIPWALNQRAISLARAKRMRVILDPAPAQQLADADWQGIDIVTPNESEASAITGIAVQGVESAAEAGKWFISRGVGAAIVTLGAKGVALVTTEGSQHFPAPSVLAVDTTAAGDAFAGYLGAGLSEGKSLENAIDLAVRAASISVTKVGASSSLPSRGDVETFSAN